MKKIVATDFVTLQTITSTPSPPAANWPLIINRPLVNNCYPMLNQFSNAN